MPPIDFLAVKSGGAASHFRDPVGKFELRARAELHWRELNSGQLICRILVPLDDTPSECHGFNAQVAQLCAAGGLAPQITQRAGQFTALAGLVAGGLGVAFVPDPLRHLQIADVVYRPLAKINQLSDLAMVYRKSERAPAVIAFVEQLKKWARPARL